MPFSPLDDCLADLRAGKMVILTDDENRENEGDLICPAQFCSPEAVTFLLSVARGYMCLSMTEEDCDRLELPPQAAVNTSVRGTAFTVSVDGHPRHGFTTGVSARERSRCIQMLVDPTFGPADFVRPGHINPLRSRDGGVLVRTGQTEGSLDLCRLAGLYPACAIIEIMRDDGEMARLPDLEKIAAQHHLKICSVAQIIEHRLRRESLVRRLAPHEGRPVRTPWGTFTAHLFQSMVDPLPHLVLTMGDVDQRSSPAPALVRVHRWHLMGDTFADLDSSPSGPTGDTLRASMQAIAREGRGAIVYLRHQTHADEHADLESRLQTPQAAHDPGSDDPHLSHPAANAVPRDMRDNGIGSQILRDLGLTRLRLLTTSRKNLPNLEAFGIEVVEQIPIPPLSAY